MSGKKSYHEWKFSDFTKITPISELKAVIESLNPASDEGEWSSEYYKPVVTIMDKDESCRYKNFLDSSIWFYKCDNSKTNLSYIEEKIKKNKARYWLKCALEYRDFYTRMLTNNFVNGDHKKFVFPFLFHSEQELKRKNEDDEHKEIINEIKKYKWRILLIDDHTLLEDESGIVPNPLTPKWCTQDAGISQKRRDDKLKSILNPTDEKLPTKLDIVVEELQELFGRDSIATKIDTANTIKNARIYVDCASTLSEAQKKLKEKKYEIILLDYLLGDKEDGGREYCYELLEEIKIQENQRIQKDKLFKKGPDNRFYFMFISAFTSAVSERLLAKGWARSEDYWYIGEGACPVNTPYLFQYRLLHIMQKRMKEMGLTKWNLKKQEEQNDSSKNENAKKKPFACLLKTVHETFTKEVVEEHNNIYTELIKEIYSSKDEARQRANEKFQDVLDLLYHYKSLIKDTHITENCFDSNESVLATEFIKKHMNYEGVLEHLTQLVYLTAFGTVRQWPEMWEEYQYIKSVLGKIDGVEIYIVNLKNNSAK